MRIDTDYQSLSDIDPEIVRFYEEETRRRIIGHEGEGEDSKPVYEEYLVIVLVKPDEVTYQDVSQRRGERKSWEEIKAELVRTIAWEDFQVNHDGYLQWKASYQHWQQEQPTEIVIDADGNEEVVLMPAPVRPVTDIEHRREQYQQHVTPYDENYVASLGEYTRAWDDSDFVVTLLPQTIPKPNAEIVAYHQRIAKEERDIAVNSAIKVLDVEWQVGNNAFDIRTVIDDATTIGATQDVSQNFRLADNSWRMTTLEELKGVLKAFIDRKRGIWSVFSHWDAGDKLTPFKPNL
ncbi:hypothetical protein [Vibrio nomapromontoriensis]|uniref:hypothetical protein n=1 Tax=Vibrio nomapromontoriensis TaxID=2910246 RepID=UPI003D0B11BB